MNRTLLIDPKTSCVRVLRDATQLWCNFHNSRSILVVAFSSCVGIVAFLWLFVRLFVNILMREQTLRGKSNHGAILRQPCRYCLKGTCTRSPCECWLPPECQFCGTETGCKAGDILLFLDTLRPRDNDGSEGVAAL